MTASLTVADILDRAADHIETYGWIQDDFFGDSTCPMECPVCVRGGISVAVGRHPMFTEEPVEYAVHPLVHTDDDEDYWARLADKDQERLDLIRAAELAMAARVRAEVLPAAVYFVAEWNDDSDRTAGQVIAELRACAADLRRAGAS